MVSLLDISPSFFYTTTSFDLSLFMMAFSKPFNTSHTVHAFEPQRGNHWHKEIQTLFFTDSMFSWFIYIFIISSTCYVTYALSTISIGTRSGQSNNRNKFIMSWIPCSNHTLSKNLTQTPGILNKISLTEFSIINLSLLC